MVKYSHGLDLSVESHVKTKKGKARSVVVKITAQSPTTSLRAARRPPLAYIGGEGNDEVFL